MGIDACCALAASGHAAAAPPIAAMNSRRRRQIFCLTSATISLGGLWTLGAVELHELPMNWATWWLGDTLGVLAALPLMLIVGGEP